MSKHIAQRPRDIADCVSAYLQEGDLDGIETLYFPDSQIFFPPDQPPKVGFAGAREAFEGMVGLKPKVISDITSEVIVGDIALTRANWKVVAPDGTVLGEGQSTEVCKKFEHGGWGYFIDCPNGPPPVTD